MVYRFSVDIDGDFTHARRNKEDEMMVERSDSVKSFESFLESDDDSVLFSSPNKAEEEIPQPDPVSSDSKPPPIEPTPSLYAMNMEDQPYSLGSNEKKDITKRSKANLQNDLEEKRKAAREKKMKAHRYGDGKAAQQNPLDITDTTTDQFGLFDPNGVPDPKVWETK